MIQSDNIPLDLLWKLDDKRIPQDEKHFFDRIKYLDENDWWVKGHKEQAIQSFQLLDETNYGSCLVAKKAKKIHDSLCMKHPDLFPSIKIKMGEESGGWHSWLWGRNRDEMNPIEVEVPTHRLQMFEKFRVQLRYVDKAHQNEIDLTLPDVADEKLEDVFKCFLNYLKFGTVNFTLNNVIPLLHLANQNILIELENKCLKFINDNLDVESLTELIDFAQKNGIHDLTWICIQFVDKNRKSQIIQELVKDEEISDETRLIVSLGLRCSDLGLVPNGLWYSTKGLVQKFNKQRNMEISERYDFNNDEGKAILEKLNELGLLCALCIGETPSDEDLKILAESTPNISQLFIRNKKIKEIPQRWLTVVKELNCCRCRSLTTINALEAKKIKCRGCTSLTTLNAPLARKISCRQCESLTTINVPEAKKLNCEDCKSLVTLNALAAEELNCSCCSLTNLNAPAAKKLDCSYCDLTTLNAPATKNLNCNGCKNLTVLKAPEAIRLYCQDCTSLTALNAPEVEILNFSQCINLTTLSVPKARAIDCHGCDKLTTLNLPALEKIESHGCKRLTVLNAPVANDVNCSDCTSLATLNVQEAKKLNCSGCTSLKTIEAPEAEELDCSDCQSLAILNAPKARNLYCNGCSSFEQITVKTGCKIAGSTNEKCQTNYVSLVGTASCLIA